MKKNAKDKAPQKGRKPFFARLLESQELEKVAGGTVQTKKYPSDSDEACGGGGTAVTLKYPSDSDEGIT